MRKKLFVLFGVLVLLAMIAVPAAAITNGELDKEGHPHVGILVADVDGEPAWRCSGTLIAPTVFLTAGHCVFGATGARVWFDTDLSNNDEYPYGGDTSIEGNPIPHPEYDWSLSDPHDVGVVILAEAVDITPAVLPEEGDLDDLKESKHPRSGDWEKFTMVGYGQLVEWPPPVLTSELVRQFAESEYVALTPTNLHLSQHLSENSRWDTDDGGTCFGDSGGPAFWIDDGIDDGNEVLVAVTSTGDAQCVATGLYYRVDTPSSLNWINYFLDSSE